MQDAKSRHLRTIVQLFRAIFSQLRHVSTIGKKLVKHWCKHTRTMFCLALAQIVVFLLFSSPNFSCRRLDVYHTSTHGVNLGCRSETCCMWLAENTACKRSASVQHRTTLSGYSFANKARIDNWKNLLNCPHFLHNMVNFGPLAAKIGSVVWGTLANFSMFCILASLLQQRCTIVANQTLHNVWPSPGLVHYVHFRGFCPVMEFCQVQNSLCV